MEKVIEIMDDISTNIDEAFEKVETAFRMREHCPHYAEWLVSMATQHLAFNSRGFEVMDRMLEKHKEHTDVAFMNFATMWKGHAMRKASKVKAMIEAFPK